ncbi:MAG TPA: site-specific integrase [Kofleriaceae bacterium]|jgi:integrase
MSAKGGERILGPYYNKERDNWRVVHYSADDKRESIVFETEEKAERHKEILLADLNREQHTTATALEQYKSHLTEKGDKEVSIDVTAWAIGQFFPTATPLDLLSAKRCEKLYEELRARPGKRTKKPLAADTHRNILAQTKSFLAWCVSKGWIRENPCERVKGIGKRRPRGKSLGKSGNTLRVKEARAWYKKAVELGDGGDEGAVAALVAMLLGMRASEIVSRVVSDLDEDEAEGDLLWIPCAKTPAGRRTLEVPAVLRPMLISCAEGKAPASHIFETEEGKPHWRDWIINNVRRICGLAKVPEVTAHAMRGLLATLTAERGMAGHLIAATLGHEDEKTTMTAYAAPGAAAAGANRRGLTLLQGGKADASETTEQEKTEQSQAG